VEIRKTFKSTGGNAVAFWEVLLLRAVGLIMLFASWIKKEKIFQKKKEVRTSSGVAPRFFCWGGGTPFAFIAVIREIAVTH